MRQTRNPKKKKSNRRIGRMATDLKNPIFYPRPSAQSAVKLPAKKRGTDGEMKDQAQQVRNQALLSASRYMRNEVVSAVLPFHIDIQKTGALSREQVVTLQALEIESSRTAIRTVGSLARINEVDHLGGGLDMIPALLMTLALTDYEKVAYTLENAHASIGYYSALATLGYLDPQWVIDTFRRGLDIAGHVAWVPGGTQLNGGRLGVMIPAAVGQAAGKKAAYGKGAWVICHCGDAGWISGQALNGFNGADLHNAPITFVMHRNGIQLSGASKRIMDKDPRPIIEAMGVTIIETPSLHDTETLYTAYRDAYALAGENRPSLIYPIGYTDLTLEAFAQRYGIEKETEAFARTHGVAMDTGIWVPGALMSYRDVESMLECLFLVNELPGGKPHHDGHLKGRDLEAVLANPMLRLSNDQQTALADLAGRPPKEVVTKARPPAGHANLELSSEDLRDVALPAVGERVCPRAGSEAGYAAVAKTFPGRMFIIGCDLDTSTKLGKARGFSKPDHQFEMSIEEQASALMANGLAVSARDPQLTVFSTFGAFFEGIAREGFEMWRYQRNLNGVNEGLNVTFHMSHVGACTGRDHFSGWALDWITLAMGYLPYLHRFYAPADARSAFVAVKDLAAHYGGHIIGIPRDSLPILEKQDGSGPLWTVDSAWEPVTPFRRYPGAKKAILAFGAPAFLADEASARLTEQGMAVDVYILNGLPLPGDVLAELFAGYPEGVVTIEDGIIATREEGLRGFAGLISSAAHGTGVPLEHVGITDPRIAPSDGHMEVWAHFGITVEGLVEAVTRLHS